MNCELSEGRCFAMNCELSLRARFQSIALKSMISRGAFKSMNFRGKHVKKAAQ